MSAVTSKWTKRSPVRAPAGLRRRLRSCCVVLLLVFLASAAQADLLDRSKRIYDRLVGVPPTPEQLTEMLDRLGPGPGEPSPAQWIDAAQVAIEHPDFYNVSLVNFVAPWTNVERSVFTDLNDYSVTVIGMIRDGVPFDQVLTANLVYVAAPGVVPTAYEHTSNRHYEQIQSLGIDLSDDSQVIGVPQTSLPGTPLDSDATAGVLTTRAAAEAFFSAGTNRRMLRFTTLNYLCRDLEALKDTSRPADFIRQDVNRSPGGDSEIFHTQCVGCHAGMDSLAGAYAYYEWDADAARLVYAPGQVQGKYTINSNVFAGGYLSTDDRWLNPWRDGQNSALGWSPEEPGRGVGMKTLGAEIAHSRAFAICQVEKVFAHVCFRPPQSAEDADAVERIASDFESDGVYDLRQVFTDVAIHCTEGE